MELWSKQEIVTIYVHRMALYILHKLKIEWRTLVSKMRWRDYSRGVITHLSSSTFNIKKASREKNTRNENIFSLVSTTAERHQMRKGKKEKQQEQKVFLLVVYSMFLESRLSFPSCVFSVWVLILHLSQFLCVFSRISFSPSFRHAKTFTIIFRSQKEREGARETERGLSFQTNHYFSWKA